MTFWSTVAAVLWAVGIFRVLDLAVEYVVGLYRQKKIDRILDELHEFWEATEEAAETKKPAKKKVAAKKK